MTEERQSAALGVWASEHDNDLVSSDVLRTELLRAALRASASSSTDLLPRAHEVIDVISLIPVSRDTFRLAGLLMPVELRSLDAIHLAVAMSLGDDLDGMVTYDDRLARAAHHWGIAVITPS